jgi:hypothetical protein
MAKELLLREGDEIRCPHCSGPVKLICISLNHPTDGMMVRIDTDPLVASVIDGGVDCGWFSLGVSCARCTPKRGDNEYLTLRDGDTRAGTFVARAHWDDD